MPDSNPALQAGDQPRSTPGKDEPGDQPVALDRGQDVERDGYYLDTETGAIHYFHRGDTVPQGRNVWYFLTAERDISMPDVRALVPRYGIDPARDDLHFVPPHAEA